MAKGKTVKYMPRFEKDEGTSIRIPCGGVDLEGDLILPQEPLGVVLFAHGSGSSRHSSRNQYVARVLREHAIGTLLFDLLTREEESEDQLTGHLRFDIELLAKRLLAATEWMDATAPDLAVGYFGASTGGGAALVAAVQSKFPISAVVSRGGRPDLAASALPRVKAPTLLIVGGNDRVVIELNQQAYDQLQCPKELKIVPGASHLFEESGALEQVARMAAAWFSRHVAPH